MSKTRLHRVVLSFFRIDEESLTVKICSWRPDEYVKVPRHLVPSDVMASIKPGGHFLAYTNIGADRAEDLVFERFEIAPPPADLDDVYRY